MLAWTNCECSGVLGHVRSNPHSLPPRCELRHTNMTQISTFSLKFSIHVSRISVSCTKLCSCNNNTVGSSCTAGDLSLNAKCYRKFQTSGLSWYGASNFCLSRGGSLAVLADIGNPSDNTQLTAWLNTERVYWIGLIRSWWKTTTEGEFELLC